MNIAKVVVDIALDKEFDYLIPPPLTAQVKPGVRVKVSFGKTFRTGWVVGIAEHSDVKGLKEIIQVIDPYPLLSEHLLKLIRWMADYYCCPVEKALMTALPAPVRRERFGFKKGQFVTLAVKELPPELTNRKKQMLVLATLQKHGGMYLSDLLKETKCSHSTIHTLAKKGFVNVEEVPVHRTPMGLRNVIRTSPLKLMDAQATALKEIITCIDRMQHSASVPRFQNGHGHPHVVLLHGVTGSGKTEVYLQAIAHCIQHNMGAIVLVPEISLTPQTVERFVARFGERVAVLHSKLSEGERHDEWHRIRDGKADIVIGARSAVFAPVQKLGLIVVDEENDTSYKQEEMPRYNARDVAVMRGYIENCAVVLGSATPSLESWYNSITGKYIVTRIPHRVDNRLMPFVRIVDMRAETARTGKPSVFSRELIEAIKTRLEKAEQTMLFLNRRGFASALICPRCGYVEKCNLCSVACTYHKATDELRCHICGLARKVPERCPNCDDTIFRFAGVGTQRVEIILKKLFPKARIQRMDTDSTSRKNAHQEILSDFRTGKIDILVGTQMIAKGLDFPNVTLVGVIYADMSLHLPDFRSGERTFQLLAQVAGRAGRGDIRGEVIVQTFTPHHPAIQFACEMNYEDFCKMELASRKELNYPPYRRLICVWIKGTNESIVSYSAKLIRKKLAEQSPSNIIISEACPAPVERAKGVYRYQIIIRTPRVAAVTKVINHILSEVQIPSDVSCVIDVDAINLI
jgi:primosomal protein N' (replication factor Y)